MKIESITDRTQDKMIVLYACGEHRDVRFLVDDAVSAAYVIPMKTEYDFLSRQMIVTYRKTANFNMESFCGVMDTMVKSINDVCDCHD